MSYIHVCVCVCACVLKYFLKLDEIWIYFLKRLLLVSKRPSGFTSPKNFRLLNLIEYSFYCALLFNFPTPVDYLYETLITLSAYSCLLHSATVCFYASIISEAFTQGYACYLWFWVILITNEQILTESLEWKIAIQITIHESRKRTKENF